MSPRHPVRALTLLATTLLLLTTGTAFAQPDIPPARNDLGNGRPWTYQFMGMVMVGALAVTALLVVLYLVKARGFRANAKRGGSK